MNAVLNESCLYSGTYLIWETIENHVAIFIVGHAALVLVINQEHEIWKMFLSHITHIKSFVKNNW